MAIISLKHCFCEQEKTDEFESFHSHKAKTRKFQNMLFFFNLTGEYNSVKTLVDTFMYDEYHWEVTGDGGIPDGSQLRFYLVSLLSLFLGQQGHQTILPKAGLATAD